MKKTIFSLFLLLLPFAISLKVSASQEEKGFKYFDESTTALSAEDNNGLRYLEILETAENTLIKTNSETNILEISDEAFVEKGFQFVFDLGLFLDNTSGYSYLLLENQNTLNLSNLDSWAGNLLVIETYKDYYLLGFVDKGLYNDYDEFETPTEPKNYWTDFVRDMPFFIFDKNESLKICFEHISYPTEKDKHLTFYTSVDNPATVEYIKNHIRFIDEYDNQESSVFEIKNDIIPNLYTNSINEVGDYSLKFFGRDKHLNSSFLHILVKVRDVNPPIIYGAETLSTSYKDRLTDEMILSRYTAKDTHKGDLTDQIEIIQNDYADNWNKTGSYLVKLKVSDGVNETIKDIHIVVYDKTPPAIEIDEGIFFETGVNDNLSIEEIIEQLKKQGALDENVTKANYSLSHSDYVKNKAGNYKVLLEKINPSYDGKDEILINISVLDNKIATNTTNKNQTIYIILGVVAGISLLSIVILFGVGKIKKRKQK